MSGTLYLVATPIGNLNDMSMRGVETLREADFIAAEDTRVTGKLLNRFEIKKPTVSYHEHNKRQSGEAILRRLLAGENCALVTDAGMPAISDPGEDLVRLCAEHGIPVIAVPGCCAAVTALAVSGLSSRRFCFEGFLPMEKKERTERLEALKTEKRTSILYEAPHRLMRTLTELYDALGDRELAICRELTKLHEETLRTTLSEAIRHFEETPPKGEFVLVLSGAPADIEPALTEDEALARVRALQAEGLSCKDACRQVAKETGLSKNALYALAVK